MESLQQMNKEKTQESAASANPQAQASTASEGGLQSTQYLNLLERSVRVEEELKHLRVDFQKNQAAIEKRLEQNQAAIEKRLEQNQAAIDKRFEQMQHNMDKRFEQMQQWGVRREEEIKHLRLDFQKSQESIDKRFGQMQQSGVRIEEEIKHLRLDFQTMQHNMDKRFEQMQHNMDKRFEQMDTRFQDLHKSFLRVQWVTGISLLLIGTILTLLGFFPKGFFSSWIL